MGTASSPSPPEEANLSLLPDTSRRTPGFRLPRRRSPAGYLRRKKPTVVQLGGRHWWGCRLAGALRRFRLRCMAVKYRRALKRIRALYTTLVREMAEGAAAIEAAQSRAVMTDAYFGVPVMSLAVNTGQTRYFF